MSIFKALILMLQDVIQKSVMALTGTNLKNKRYGDVGFFCSLTLLGKNNPNCTEAGRCFGVLYTIYKKTVQDKCLQHPAGLKEKHYSRTGDWPFKSQNQENLAAAFKQHLSSLTSITCLSLLLGDTQPPLILLLKVEFWFVLT